MPTAGILPGTTAYAAQVLRTKQIHETSSFNSAGIDPLLSPLIGRFFPFGTGSVFGFESNMILSARGTFYQVKLASNYGPGVYSIDELTREVTAPDFTGPSLFRRPGEATSPILLTGVEFNQVDITSQVPCLDNVKVFYSFGQNFGQVVISGEVLLGPLGDINYDGVDRLISFFWKNRVSEKRQAIAVSVANNSYFVYLTGLRISRVDPDFHIMPFVMFGTLLDISRENASVVNVSGKVVHGGNLDEPSLFQAMLAMPSASGVAATVPPENPAPLSPTNNPSLNSTPGGGTGHASNAGAAGNSVAAATQAQLTGSSGPQSDIDSENLKMLQAGGKERFQKAKAIYAGAGDTEAASRQADDQAAPLLAEAADYEKAVKYGRAVQAQKNNLAADGKTQNYQMTPEIAANKPIYDRLIADHEAKQAGNSLPVKKEGA